MQWWITCINLIPTMSTNSIHQGLSVVTRGVLTATSGGLIPDPASYTTATSNGTETCIWIITPYKSVEPPAITSLGMEL